ncbi:MAG: dehydrogenase [Gammaproteobacteria bacterium RIFCSPHIGHO2_12_FULL_37_14]|nr:MAG: dehydrogenase [Gammaproteobacteria bacterium RIFCSPHIGHO2_12_FULL_37_14]
MKLVGCSAIISGASQGLGFEIARQFVLEGANVMLCARSPQPLYEAQAVLAKLATNQAKVLAMPVDISNPEQVSHLVKTTIAEFGQLTVLVANAGIYGTKGPIDEIDWDEWSRAIDINLKGTVIQCRSVLPYFKQQKHGKIIILSGGGATKPMPNFSAYATSKAGVVRFAETLAEEVKDFNIDVNTVAPGALNTRLLDEVLAAGPEKVGAAFYNQSLKQQQSGGTPLSVGAALCTFLASNASKGITGRLISAVWDQWQDLPKHINDLNDSDVYTLRRITPQDRGKTWGDV